MGKKSYRIVIPLRPGSLILLSENIVKKHLSDLETSPLRVIDMVDMEAKTIFAREQDTLALQLNRDKELAYEQRDLSMGIYPGHEPEMPGTLVYYIRSCRDTLLGVYKDNRETLKDFGFKILSDRQAIKIPVQVPLLIDLAQKILERHNELGDNSPLKILNMSDFEAVTSTADTKNNLALELSIQKTNAFLLRNKTLGKLPQKEHGKAGTLLFYVTSVRDVLLGVYKKTESELGMWGFDVYSSSNKIHGKSSLSGIVSDTDGEIIKGARLTLVELEVSTNTPKTGKYTFRAQPAGTYTLQVKANGFEELTIPDIIIQDKHCTKYNVTMIPKGGTLIVNIYSNGLPLADARVLIRESGVLKITNDQGKATFTNLAAGIYYADVSAAGKLPESKSIKIQNNVSDMLIFDLKTG
jgi:hypothetical protein